MVMGLYKLRSLMPQAGPAGNEGQKTMRTRVCYMCTMRLTSGRVHSDACAILSPTKTGQTISADREPEEEAKNPKNQFVNILTFKN